MANKNAEILQEKFANHAPYISFDVEATGIMNGNDNRITQIAAAKYEYNGQSKRYELQDHIFMLAKGDKDVIANIEQREKPTKENAETSLKEEFEYIISSKIQKAEQYIADKVAEKTSFMTELEREGITKKEEKSLLGKIATRDRKIEKKLDEAYMKFVGVDRKTLLDSDECKQYISDNLPSKLEQLKNNVKLDEVLEQQGIDKVKWLESGEGLTAAEMQIGITEFFNKHCTDDTFIMTNGTYYAAHYMAKEGISFPQNAECISVTSAANAVSHYSCDFSQFAESYQNKTGRTIKTFDAFTKCLCLSEIASAITGTAVAHTSLKHLENSVKEKAMSQDEGCVMSARRASSMLWIPEENPNFCNADFIFDSLEYVQFGNDRRYVDIDKMFEINNNFEVTLEGDKEPIKSWEELEAKIKSLNAEISDVLLDRIKEKYEEVLAKAIEYENNTISSADEEEETAETTYYTSPPDKDKSRCDLPFEEDTEYYGSDFTPEYTPEAKQEAHRELAEAGGRNDTYKLQSRLQGLLETFEQSFEALRKEKEDVGEKYNVAAAATLKKAESELPSLISFAHEAAEKIGANGDCLTVYICKIKPDRVFDVSFSADTADESHKSPVYFVFQNEGQPRELLKYVNGYSVRYDVQNSTLVSDRNYVSLLVENYKDIKEGLINKVVEKVNEYIHDKTEELVEIRDKTEIMNEYLDK